MEASYAQKVDGALHNMRVPFRHYPRCPKCPLSKDMSLMWENKIEFTNTNINLLKIKNQR